MTKLLKISKLNFKKKEELNTEGQNSKTYKILDLQLNADLVLKEIKKEDLTKTGEEDYFKESKILYMCERTQIFVRLDGLLMMKKIFIYLCLFIGTVL